MTAPGGVSVSNGQWGRRPCRPAQRPAPLSNGDTTRCRDELTADAAASTAAAQDRLRRIHELLKFVTLMDSLAQRFFESQRGLREAFERLAQDEAE